MKTYRQCNKCKQFRPKKEVPEVQVYGKLYPVGPVMCLCETCRSIPLEIGYRYLRVRVWDDQ